MHLDLRTYTGWLLLAAVIALVLLIYGVVDSLLAIKTGPAVRCAAYFNLQTNFTTEGVLAVDLDGSGHGRISISGAVTNSQSGKTYRLLRDVIFNYKYDGQGFLIMKDIDTIKKVPDAMPDTLFNQTIFDFSATTRRFRITTVGNSYLLWNEFSPILMCNRNN